MAGLSAGETRWTAVCERCGAEYWLALGHQCPDPWPDLVPRRYGGQREGDFCGFAPED
jgi:hypothetical protein